MLKTTKNLAFTLVELIVVITIIVILGTIALISLEGYTSDARDSVRVTDLKNIKGSLDREYVVSGQYLLPDNAKEITFSGALLWTQGTYGETNFKNTKGLSEAPTDPVSGTEYTYSVANNRDEMEVAAALENGEVLSFSKTHTDNQDGMRAIPTLVNQTYAADHSFHSTYVLGNYNGQVLKTSTGGIDYVLSLPGIITSNTSTTNIDITTLISNRELIVHKSQKFPASYGVEAHDDSPEKHTYLDETKLVAFEGNIQDLRTDESLRLSLANNVQEAYSGSLLENDLDIEVITGADLSSGSSEGQKRADELVVYRLDLEIDSVETDDSAIVEWTVPEDLTQLFASNSQFTQNWETNSCDSSNMTVIDVAPGIDTIPENLFENTIYKLTTGEYITSRSINVNNCGGIVGNSATTIYSSVYLSNGFFTGSNVVNSIIYGITLNGEDDGSVGIHAQNATGVSLSSNSNDNTISGISVSSTIRGIYFYYSSNNTLEDIDVVNSAIGIEMYYASKDNTLNNITLENNTSHGIKIRSISDGNTLSNIDGVNNKVGLNLDSSHLNRLTNISFGLGETGVYLYDASDNIFDDVKLYTNTYPGNLQARGVGLYVYNGSDNNIINNLYSYNNSHDGVEISSSEGNTFNNGGLINNKNGVLIRGSSGKHNIMNNMILSNNSGLGADANYSAYDNMFNNIGSFNNSYGARGKQGQFWNKVLSYNNSAAGFLFSGSTPNYYYSNLSLFSNGSSTYFGTLGLVGTDGLNSSLNLPNGQLLEDTETFDATWAVMPNIDGWDYTLKGEQCKTSETCTNNVLTGDFDENTTFTFGSNIPNQTQPIKWNTTSSQFEYYGVDGIDYDSTKKIGEW